MKNINLDYQLYLQREEEFYHQPYENEVRFYSAIQRGDIAYIESCKEEYETREDKPFIPEGKGVLSTDPIKNERYHLIVNATIITRKCIESGLDQESAYTLSDLYIRLADEAHTVRELREINDRMVREFTLKMKEMHFRRVISSHISKCIAYIYDHLHEQITVEKLSELVQLTPSYLSSLFKKETGTTLHKFIQDKRLETAKNLLTQSDHTSSEIAAALSFSSQSHFIKLFKKKYGVTPKEYRNRYSSKNIIEQ